MEDSSNIANYMSLAAAIYERGVRENDTVFLSSKWAQFLYSSVLDYKQAVEKSQALYGTGLSGSSAG